MPATPRLPANLTQRSLASAAAAMLAVASSLVATGAEAAGRLHVIVERLPCPAPARLTRQIERRSADAAVGESEFALVVNVDDADRLTLKLLGSGRQAEQTMPFRRQDCPELANTVVLLVRSWLTSAWDAPALPPPAPPAPEPPRTPVAAEPLEIVEAPPPRAPAWLRFGALGGVFVTSGQGAQAAISLDGHGDLGPRWGVGAVALYHAAVRSQVETGNVAVKMQAIGPVAYLKLSLDERTRVELIAGPVLTAITARSENFARAVTSHLYDTGLVASARLRARLSERLEWVAEAQLVERLHTETLVVVGSQRTLTVSRSRLSVLTGLSIDVL